MKNTSVFRKVSLDRLSSPEQLDQLMHVTDLRGWVVLAAFAVLILTGVVWGFAGSVPETISAPGILIKTGGVFQVTAQSAGRIVDLSVSAGDTVREGQTIARVAQPDLAEKLSQAREELRRQRERHTQLVASGGRDSALQLQYMAEQRASLDQSIGATERQVQSLTERLHSEEQLVTQGLLTRSTLLATQQQYESARQRVADTRSQVTQLASREQTLLNTRREELRSSQDRVEQSAVSVIDLERQLSSSSKITAPYSGRILEVLLGEGSRVGPGEGVLNLDLTGSTVKRLEAVIYVPSVEGKRIRPGMTIRVAPNTVKQEEYGLMLGRVTHVSDFPSTAQGMMRVLNNDRLVNELSGKDAPYEVHADLIVDPTTVSQYRWTSSKGPPATVQSGTLANANIEVATSRPIAMAIPLFKKLSGI